MTWSAERARSVRSTKRVKELDDEEHTFSACLTHTEQIRHLQLPGRPISPKMRLWYRKLRGVSQMLRVD